MKEKFYISLKILVGIVIFGIFVHKNTNASEGPINDYTDEKTVYYSNDIDTIVIETKACDDNVIIKEKIDYKISEEGKQFIIKYEKCHLTSYKDLGGGYTIGYGHHNKDVKPNMTISQKQADKLFEEDIIETEEYARYLINQLPYKYEFSQEFFDGLCDLIYNAGIGAVQNSIFYKRLQKCRIINGDMHIQDYEFTIAAVKNLNAPYKGHKIRRQECYKNMINNI